MALPEKFMILFIDVSILNMFIPVHLNFIKYNIQEFIKRYKLHFYYTI